MKILILTGKFGLGHWSASQSLRQQISRDFPRAETDTGWGKNVIITMLKRLETKGAVRHEEGEKAKQFYPAVSRDETALEETRGFLNRVYNGSLGLMVNAMVNSRALTDQEIEELQEILKKAEEGRHV